MKTRLMMELQQLGLLSVQSLSDSTEVSGTVQLLNINSHCTECVSQPPGKERLLSFSAPDFISLRSKQDTGC